MKHARTAAVAAKPAPADRSAGPTAADLDAMPEVDFSGPNVRRGRHAGKRTSLLLADVRKVVGLTQVQVAEAIGLSQGEVSRFEGQADMLLSTLQRYVEALGCKLEVWAVNNDTQIKIDVGKP